MDPLDKSIIVPHDQTYHNIATVVCFSMDAINLAQRYVGKCHRGKDGSNVSLDQFA